MRTDHTYFSATGEPTQDWWNVVGRFKAKAKEFWDYYDKLKAVDPSTLTPELRDRRETLLNRYEIVRSTVEDVTWAINQVISWFGGGSSNETSDVGFLSVIGIGAIAAAVAAMGYIISDTVTYFQRVSVYKDALNRGVDPSKAADLSQKVGSGSGFFSEMGSGVMTASLGILAVLILPKFFKGK